MAQNVNRQELDSLGLTEQEGEDIAAFLLALNNDYGPGAGD